MPSPFPGMDPYLEDPAHWPDVHHELISGICDQLTQRLRPRYVGRIARRTYRPEPDDPELAFYLPRQECEHGNTAKLSPAVPSVRLLDGEFREARVEIVEVSSRQVVTVIEVISPSNKIVGTAGRRSFVAKRLEIMNSAVHWVEIDLLRGNTSLDPLVLNRLQPHDYYVHASRAEDRPREKVCLVHLDQPLPTVGVPLRSPDADAPLDLQSVLATAYDRAGYDLTIDYTRPPVPPLSKTQTKWAKAMLAKAKRK